ncbi:MAG TPA: hypothetical protein VII32_00230 [Thermoanaerobaculia bacterium]|jgi:hypothetical protein
MKTGCEIVPPSCLNRRVQILLARSSADLGDDVPPHHSSQNAPESSERFLQHAWQLESLAGHFFRQSSNHLPSPVEVAEGRGERTLDFDACALTEAGKNPDIVRSKTIAVHNRFFTIMRMRESLSQKGLHRGLECPNA